MVGLGHCGHSQVLIRMFPVDSRLNWVEMPLKEGLGEREVNVASISE